MSDKVIDLRPLIQRKKASQCTHRHTSVDDDLPSLTCDDCEAELDPWWLLRREAEDSESALAWYAARRAEHDEWLVEAEAVRSKLMRQVDELNTEVQRLNDLRNELNNESFGGRLLGSIARKRKARQA